jgi:hypothetical protein
LTPGHPETRFRFVPMYWKFLFAVALYGLFHRTAVVQLNPLQTSSNPRAALMSRIFGDIKAFTATVEGQVLDTNGAIVSSWTVERYALLNGKLRIDERQTANRHGYGPPEIP